MGHGEAQGGRLSHTSVPGRAGGRPRPAAAGGSDLNPLWGAAVLLRRPRTRQQRVVEEDLRQCGVMSQGQSQRRGGGGGLQWGLDQRGPDERRG